MTPKRCLLLLCVLLVPSAATAPAAAIAGRVTLPGRREAKVINQRYEVVARGGTLSITPPLAVVYLEGRFPRPAQPPVARVVQKDLEFVPALLAVQAGTRVEFPNLDDTYHNIFSYSPAKRFDLGRYRGDERPIPSETFDEPGLVTLRCDIHEHMRALILVVDTPYFAVTAEDGAYALSGLPAGRYVLKAWLDSKTVIERPVELAADSRLQIDLP